jgi:hypothetical protein
MPPVPYGGNPANYPEDIDILAGSDLPNTTNFNTPYEGLADRTAWLRGAVVAGGAANWSELANVNPGIISGGGTTIYSGGWDPLFEQWILANTIASSGTVTTLYSSSFNGQDWYPLYPLVSNPTWLPIAMAVQPATGIIASVRSDLSSHYSVTTQVQGQASVEQTVASPGMINDVGQGCMVYFYSTVNAASKGWLFVGATGAIGTTSWNGGALFGGPAATQWTNATTYLPASFSPLPASSPNQVYQWLAAIDESFPAAGDCNNVVFAQCGTKPGTTDRSHLLQWNQAAPTTFADITPTYLSSGTRQVRGIAWGPVDQLWGMVCVDGDDNGNGASPVNSYFLTSPDLVTWTLVYTFADYHAGGLACAGNVWSVILNNSAFSLNAAISNRVVYSNNVSLGVLQTWQAANYMDNPLTSICILASSGSPQRLYMGNGQQFCTAYLYGATTPVKVGAAATSQGTLGVGII